MKAWLGKSFVLIGAAHTVVGLVAGHTVLAQMAREGLINTVVMQYDRNAVFWFLFTGFVLILFGALVDWAERAVGLLPRFLGPSMLALTIVGVVIMPQSGFWLLFVPSVGLLRWRPTADKSRSAP